MPRKRIEFFSYCDFFVFFQTLIIYGWRVKYVGAIQDGKQDDLELRRISRKKPRKARKSKREKTNICFFFSLCLLWYIYWKRYCKLLTFMAAITHQDICSSCHLKKFFQKVVLRHCVALERQIWLEFLMIWPLKGPSWRPLKGGLCRERNFICNWNSKTTHFPKAARLVKVGLHVTEWAYTASSPASFASRLWGDFWEEIELLPQWMTSRLLTPALEVSLTI